ncbi:MAG: outer membrane lipoprotein chaperone LolA [SAR324 cluster bacterium]|nr:outer membrane lipoprotein chaperone LolA [SAR324 cluster bacterium]
MKWTNCLLLIWFLLIIFGTHVAAAESNVLDHIQKRYQEISSFEGKFFQKNYTIQDKNLRSASGIITYIRPGKMRWEYHKPDEQLLVTDGTTLWLFDPLLENVTVQELEKVTQGTPLSFLLGAGDLKTDFMSRPITQKLVTDANFLVVELLPKKQVAALDFIQLAVDPGTFDLKQIVLVDRQGNYRTIAFEDMQYNVALNENQFHFEISPEMEVIYADE